MVYLLKQKFNIRELTELAKPLKRVLLVVEDEVLSEIYRRHLEAHEFEVRALAFGDHLKIVSHLGHCDLLVLEIRHAQETAKLEFLRIVARQYPYIPAVTVGFGLEEQILRILMDLGVVGHLDRRFSQPRDLVTMIKTVVHNRKG